MARFDFPVISYENGETREPAGAGTGVTIERVHEDLSWCEKGDEVGFVVLEMVKIRADRVLLSATFEFNTRETISLKGVVPWDDQRSRLAAGRLGVIAGTGRFQDRRGSVDLDVCNPKRWG